MKPPVPTKVRLFLPFVLLVASVVCISPAHADDKLKPEDLVAKHLESIGTAEARARVNGTRIKGSCTVSVRLCGEGQVDGQVMLGSTHGANLINMNFDIAAYAQEAFRYDGKRLATSQLKPGSRTCLSQFFLENEVLFKEGLVGGVLFLGLYQIFPTLAALASQVAHAETIPGKVDRGPEVLDLGLERLGSRNLGGDPGWELPPGLLLARREATDAHGIARDVQ